MTAPAGAVSAISLGVDALGLNFFPSSSRYISIDKALEIADIAHPFVTLVGLFVDAQPRDVEKILKRVPLQLLQFHGNETADYCESFGLAYIKAIRVGAQDNLIDQISSYRSAQAVLLDTYKKGQPGGTGESFNWSLVPKIDKPIILAGGLTSENVSEAISRVKPYAVDTSGGVESAPGIKDPDRMQSFFEQVHKADLNLNVRN